MNYFLIPLLIVTGLGALFFLVRWRGLISRQRRGRFVPLGKKKVQLMLCLLCLGFFLFALTILIVDWATKPGGPDDEMDGPSILRNGR